MVVVSQTNVNEVQIGQFGCQFTMEKAAGGHMIKKYLIKHLNEFLASYT